MPIIPIIGRKATKTRALISVIYAVLIAGCVTMVYPFMIMLSGSTKGVADSTAMDAVPAAFYSEQMRFVRFVEDRYATNLIITSAAYGKEIIKPEETPLPADDPEDVRKFEEFLEKEMSNFPPHFYVIQEFEAGSRVMPRNFRRFRAEVRNECPTVDDFKRRFDMPIASWNEFPRIRDNVLITREFAYEKDALMDRYLEFKTGLPANERAIVNVDGYYACRQTNFDKVRSKEWTPNPILAERMPAGKDGEMWTEFVKYSLNCNFVQLDPAGLTRFRNYLVDKTPGGIEKFNKINDASFESFDEIRIEPHNMRISALFVLYSDFVTNECPPKHFILDTPNVRYRKYLGSETALAPIIAHDYEVFKATRASYLWEVFTRNYLSVIEFMTVYGRALRNTIVFVGLSICGALLVNPLAAYALSRFKLKQTYTILMFFIATMSFPAAVSMIPNFLLLKQLGLLNTFWALVLPGLGNGYWIFILKGFFDSIPREVYESAQIDGAGEWTMFWRFTMALSKPILALITLGAFTSAYTAFMFALIICPDKKMWTLMVWLYQLQQGAAQPIIYSALVLASIPTLLVFVFAQNTIMKGIVVPVEK